MRRRLTILLLASTIVASGAFAQKRPAGLQPLPEPPEPPPGALQAAQAAETPQVTTRKQDGDSVEEFRVGGRVVMIRVTPARGLPYILTDPKGDGSFSQRRDSLDVPLSVPMWVLFTF
ncbi:MAG: DUF2782 domain-containing protein [Betaproteobacteria bacterium]